MATSYLQKQISSAGSTTTATISVWVKRNKISSGEHSLVGGIYTANDRSSIYFDSSDKITVQHYEISTGVSNLVTNRVFRDVNAWYHIVVNYDTSNATADNRLRLYVNGVEETSFATRNNPSLNLPIAYFKSSTYFDVNGRWGSGGANAVGSIGEQLMSHLHVIDGTVYDASAFGETDATTGIWKPKTEPSVTYGTNGFFLKFENSGSMGTDSSPNGNNFTVSGSVTQTVDTPSNVFATWNPLDNYYFQGVFANGNTTATTGPSQYTWCTSTLGASSGKWYWEVEYDAKSGGSDVAYVGITPSTSTSTTAQPSFSNNQYYYYSSGSGEGVTMGDSYTTGDIIGIALDLDNNKIYFSKNGTFQNSGDPTSGATGTGAISITDPASTTSGNYFATVADGSSTYNATFKANFGSGYFGTTPVASAGSNGNGAIFEYDVPTGYYALNTKNINTYG